MEVLPRKMCELQPGWWALREGKSRWRNGVSRSKVAVWGKWLCEQPEKVTGDENQREAVAILGNPYIPSQGFDFNPIAFDSQTCLAGPQGICAIFLRDHKTTG